jgi:uncharacterized protein (DUF983 family)
MSPLLPAELAHGVAGRCPRCGRGRLYRGFLALAPACDDCGLDFRGFDAADGPAVFVIFIVGFVVTVAALVTELKWQPPFWVHAALWLPLTLGLSLGLLRPLKGLMVGLQYRNKAEEGRPE